MALARRWDLPTRLFHWALAALVVFSFVTGKAGGGWMEWHLRSGYAILALLLFRLAWGFAGPPESRFLRFVKGPVAVAVYLRGWLAGRLPAGAGHNPAGGWMVALMLALLLVQATTGLFSDDDIRTQGPLAVKASSAWVERMSDIHALNQWLVAGAVALHVIAIAAYWLRFRENLAATMGFGGRPRSDSPHVLVLAAIAASLAAAAVYLLVVVYPRG